MRCLKTLPSAENMKRAHRKIVCEPASITQDVFCILSQRMGYFKANKYRLFQHKEWRLSHCRHFYVTQ